MAPRSAKKVKTSSDVPIKDKQDILDGQIPVPEFLLVPDKFVNDSEEESGSEDADIEDSEGETSDNSDNPNSSTSAKRKRARELQKLLDRKKKERRKRTTTSPLEPPANSDEECNEPQNSNHSNLENKKFLKAVKQYPCIYDPALKDTIDRKQLKSYWAEIANETGCTNPRKKFSNLKLTYQRIKKRMIEAGGGDSSTRFALFEDMKLMDEKSNGGLLQKSVIESEIINPVKPKKKESVKKKKNILKLLEGVKSVPYLYNLSLRKDMTQLEVRLAWDKIRKESGIDNPNKTFQNLKVTYKRIQRRMSFGESGAVKFPYMKEMQFIDGFVDENNVSVQDNNSYYSSSSEDSCEEEQSKDRNKKIKKDSLKSNSNRISNTIPSKDAMKHITSKSKSVSLQKSLDKIVKEINLLEAVKRYPCLYDPAERKRTNAIEIRNIWDIIEMETEMENPSKKFSNMKISYERIKKRIKNGIDFQIRFPHLQRMQFLDGQDVEWPEGQTWSETDTGTQDINEDSDHDLSNDGLDFFDEMEESKPDTIIELSENKMVKEESCPDQDVVDYESLSVQAIRSHFGGMVNDQEKKVLHDFIAAAVQGKVYEIMANRNQ